MAKHFMPYEIMHKVEAVINSCKTGPHLVVAKRYVDVATKFVLNQYEKTESKMMFAVKQLHMLDVRTSFYNKILKRYRELEKGGETGGCSECNH